MGFSIGCVVCRFFYDFIKGFGVERMIKDKIKEARERGIVRRARWKVKLKQELTKEEMRLLKRYRAWVE